ncbi:MAG: XVIPCD domain-containing protein [Stenotrophomonas koreensis]
MAIARGREDGLLDNYRIDQPGHEGNGLFVMAQAGVHKLDQQCGVVSDLHSDQLAGVVAVQAYKDGLNQIERVSLSSDCRRVIAEDFAGPGIEYQKRSAVDVVQGRSTPLEHSTTAWEEQADRQQRAQALEAVQAMPAPQAGIAR